MCPRKKKSFPDNDTIAAVITPPGEGGVAALRLAGRKSRALLEKFFVGSRGPVTFKPFTMRYGTFVTAEGETLDEVTAVYMPAGKSYTGREQVEIFCHGGRQIVRMILRVLIEAGARPAEPGEFTRLAFLSGRIDLARAEAVAEIIAANTETSFRAGREHLLGGYSQHIEEIRSRLVGLLAEVEAGIDFIEDDIEPADPTDLVAEVDAVRERVSRLLDTYKGGRIINEGLRVVIGGRPNVGKSSLFNMLLRHERALVYPTAGTTRDYLSEWIDVDGVAVNLIDTAGLRQAGAALEMQGQTRARELMKGAHLALWVVDLAKRNWRKLLQVDLKSLPKIPILLVGNKIDISPPASTETFRAMRDAVALSCLTADGVDHLKAGLADRIDVIMPDLTSGLVVTSARHQRKLSRSLKNLKSARRKLAGNETPELTAFDLRQAISDLDEITGRVYTEQVLDSIFSRFCIGK
ncbi:MAG TPA: tRNA uridine-5-carboxymethylaminomethyl(34) synthesis GTPase MnmE [Acidobacteriota bacterium]|nr:tRNA uridine-5-carboxymethylaminomethyl(34) synthesis GTPase MnmE [Acidobacteriota bacterium]